MRILSCLTMIAGLAISGCGAQPAASQLAATSSVAPTEDKAIAFDWRTALHWVQVPESQWGGSNQGSPYLSDVMNHTTDRY